MAASSPNLMITMFAVASYFVAIDEAAAFCSLQAEQLLCAPQAVLDHTAEQRIQHFAAPGTILTNSNKFRLSLRRMPLMLLGNPVMNSTLVRCPTLPCLAGFLMLAILSTCLGLFYAKSDPSIVPPIEKWAFNIVISLLPHCGHC